MNRMKGGNEYPSLELIAMMKIECEMKLKAPLQKFFEKRYKNRKLFFYHICDQKNTPKNWKKHVFTDWQFSFYFFCPNNIIFSFS